MVEPCVSTLVEFCPQLHSVDFGFCEFTEQGLSILLENCPLLCDVNFEGCDKISTPKNIELLCKLEVSAVVHRCFPFVILLQGLETLFSRPPKPKACSVAVEARKLCGGLIAHGPELQMRILQSLDFNSELSTLATENPN